MSDSSPPEIVRVAHSDLDRVKELLSEDPSLLNVFYAPWAETPLGAASHVGNRPIAEYLLSQGAPMVITTAAMLGRFEAVDAFLRQDPSLVNAVGAHGISLLYHAALGGEIAILERIISAGGSTESAGHALHAAVSKGHARAVSWLIEVGADLSAVNFQGKTPLEIALERGMDEVADLLQAAHSN